MEAGRVRDDVRDDHLEIRMWMIFEIMLEIISWLMTAMEAGRVREDL